MTFAPSINASSARLLEDSAQLPGSFLRRQRFFYDLKQQRMRILLAEVCAPSCHQYTFHLFTASIVLPWAVLRMVSSPSSLGRCQSIQLPPSLLL